MSKSFFVRYQTRIKPDYSECRTSTLGNFIIRDKEIEIFQDELEGEHLDWLLFKEEGVLKQVLLEEVKYKIESFGILPNEEYTIHESSIDEIVKYIEQALLERDDSANKYRKFMMFNSPTVTNFDERLNSVFKSMVERLSFFMGVDVTSEYVNLEALANKDYIPTFHQAFFNWVGDTGVKILKLADRNYEDNDTNLDWLVYREFVLPYDTHTGRTFDEFLAGLKELIDALSTLTSEQDISSTESGVDLNGVEKLSEKVALLQQQLKNAEEELEKAKLLEKEKHWYKGTNKVILSEGKTVRCSYRNWEYVKNNLGIDDIISDNIFLLRDTDNEAVELSMREVENLISYFNKIKNYLEF